MRLRFFSFVFLFACTTVLVSVRSAAGERVEPVVSMMTVCSRLTGNLYPNDSVNWFYPEQHSQVIFFTHLLFPYSEVAPPEAKKLKTKALPLEKWHPPLVHPGGASPVIGFEDNFYAEARWFGPGEKMVAQFSLTMAARVKSDYQELGGRVYVPHTFAMALGIKDLRKEAGQLQLLDIPGEYRIEFMVDGVMEGNSFFRVMEPGEYKSVSGSAKNP